MFRHGQWVAFDLPGGPAGDLLRGQVATRADGKAVGIFHRRSPDPTTGSIIGARVTPVRAVTGEDCMLADPTAVSFVTIRFYERGDTKRRLPQLPALEDLTGMSPAEHADIPEGRRPL